MYPHLRGVRVSQLRAFLLKRHTWTQGDGPKYDKRIMVLGVTTVLGAYGGAVSKYLVWCIFL